jgi:uncharacterized protein YqhQ
MSHSERPNLGVSAVIKNSRISKISQNFLIQLQSHKIISLLFGWLPALIVSTAPFFLDSIFYSMNLNSYTAVMDGNPKLILLLEFIFALLPHFFIIALARNC